MPHACLEVQEDAVRGLEKNLECPVCLTFCTGLIFTCFNGHLVCARCQDQLNECPSCRKPGRPTIRNYFAEAISADLQAILQEATTRQMSLADANREVVASLRNKLECVDCMFICASPIFMCFNGHNVCARCQSQLDDCPLCRRIGRPPIRNLFADAVASELWVHCDFTLLGCTERLRSSDMTRHARECKFKHVGCLMVNCEWRGDGTIGELKEHARSLHAANYIECLDTATRSFTISDAMTIGTPKSKLMFVSFNDHLFMLYRKRTVLSKFFIQFGLVGSVGAESGPEFSYKLTFCSQSGYRKFSYRSPVRKWDEIREADTMYGDLRTMGPFLGECSQLVVTLRLFEGTDVPGKQSSALASIAAVLRAVVRRTLKNLRIALLSYLYDGLPAALTFG